MKKNSVIKNSFSFFIIAFLFLGCSDESTSLFFPRSELPVIVSQGFKIPKFPTAQGQLNYAKSGFSNSEEKKAAFKIMFDLFPDAGIECGKAALHLAYFNFGYDYRFIEKKDLTLAINAYHDVIKQFKDYPQILVKAYWYLGWAHCDLLKEKERGTDYFWHIVNTYPDLPVGISSPVPWVSLVYPSSINKDQPAMEKPKKKWASIALLEIIRHSTRRTDIFNAFDILWMSYRNSVSTGLAVKFLLQDKKYAPTVRPYVEPYLNLNTANRYLAREIISMAKEY